MTDYGVTRPGGVLGRERLLALIHGNRPLISGYHSIEDQLQPNGFDLSVAEIGEIANGGAIGRTNASRSLPDVQILPFDETGWLELSPGPYQIVFNEAVDLPNTLMALGRPRSAATTGCTRSRPRVPTSTRARTSMAIRSAPSPTSSSTPCWRASAT